jgi:hypothetical protein
VTKAKPKLCPICEHPVKRHWLIGDRLCSVGHGWWRSQGERVACDCSGLPIEMQQRKAS